MEISQVMAHPMNPVLMVLQDMHLSTCPALKMKWATTVQRDSITGMATVHEDIGLVTLYTFLPKKASL